MSNTSLVSRMRHILDDYEAGRLSSEQVERAFEYHMEGIEGIGLHAVHQHLCDLTHRLVTAHMSDDLDEFIDAEEVYQVLSDMRQFLDSLPGGANT